LHFVEAITYRGRVGQSARSSTNSTKKLFTFNCGFRKRNISSKVIVIL
jgi:hypothetical protein